MKTKLVGLHLLTDEVYSLISTLQEIFLEGNIQNIEIVQYWKSCGEPIMWHELFPPRLRLHMMQTMISCGQKSYKEPPRTCVLHTSRGEWIVMLTGDKDQFEVVYKMLHERVFTVLYARTEFRM